MSEAALLLIRHAESTWNAAGRWQGHGDPPLSERGRIQANALVRNLASETIDVIVSSDLRRAAETAAVLAHARGLALEMNPRLRELDLGAWEGLTRDEIERKSSALLQRFDAGDRTVRPGGGENRQELEHRALGIVRELVDAHPGQRLAIVTHLGVIRALLGEPRDSRYRATGSDRATSLAGDSDPSARGDRIGPAPIVAGLDFANASWRHLDLLASCRLLNRADRGA